MKQSIHELTRTQLIAKVEAEVDRFRFRSGEAPEPGVKEPSHDKRMDCDFAAFQRPSWAPEALSSTATGKKTTVLRAVATPVPPNLRERLRGAWRELTR